MYRSCLLSHLCFAITICVLSGLVCSRVHAAHTPPHSPVLITEDRAMLLLQLQHTFHGYTIQFNKSYAVVAHERVTQEWHERYNNFVDNFLHITRHNELHDLGNKSYRLGINRFSDLSHSEFINLPAKGYVPSMRTRGSPQPVVRVAFETSVDRHDVDWRSKGAVGPIRDQSQCGSCFAFSGVASIESAYAIANGTLYTLSEQQVLDCSYPEGDQSCNGGEMTNVFRFAIDAGGMCTEESYPYQAHDEPVCKTTCDRVVTIGGYNQVPSGDEEALINAVETVGVISVAIDASTQDFQLYESGVYDGATCKQTPEALDHGVAIVGIQTDDVTGQRYYIMRNSWSSSWGEQGYMKMKVGVNVCGIALDASYAVA